jgi:hypothetical protein
MALLYAALFGYLIYCGVARSETQERTLVSFVLFFACLPVLQAAYHSWINDFQAQGRYLFPVIGMFGLLLVRLQNAIRPTVLVPLVLCAFALSAASFTYYAVYKPIPVSHYR